MAEKKEPGKETGHSFADYFKRAASPMLVLHLLSQEPMYVYQMAQEMGVRSNGKYTMSLLYPVIYRLVKLGFVEEGAKQISPDNRTRQYYKITDAGRTHLTELMSEYDSMVLAVRHILTYDKEQRHDDQTS